MSLLAIVVIALVCALVFGGFIWFFVHVERNPIYRTTRASMERILHQVLAGECGDIAWRTFLSVPIRHDEMLESWRLRCVEIDDQYSHQMRGYLLNKAGRAALAEVLAELQAYDHKHF